MSVFIGCLLSPVAEHEKNPPCGRVRGGSVWQVVWSVRVAALEILKHQIAHRPDVGLDAFQPISIVVAVLGSLAIGAVALC